MANPGDKVRIHTPEEMFEGVLVPSYEKDIVVLKLENGYNIGIFKGKIAKTEVLETYTEKKIKSEKFKPKKGLPTISILHTGGTIASKVDYQTGGVEAKFSPEDLLRMFPELGEIANINSRLIRNMLSENMRFSHYNILAKEIVKEIKKGSQGIIVSHGTDTIHYTAAALSFLIQDLPVPVVLVGAQRSSDRGSTDAELNLICAAHFITNTDFAEVAVCMHESMSDDSCILLPGLKTRKFHTSRRDAFKAINTRPWARIERSGTITYLRKTYRTRSKDKPKIMPFNEKVKVGVLKMHTNMYATEFLAFKNFDGLVLELTGLGHAPTEHFDDFTREHLKIRKAIEDIGKKTVLVGSPQPIYGRLNMNVYSPGRDLQKMGVLGHLSDMTTETTFIKLAWLLSNYSKREIPELMSESIRGELSERIEDNTFLV
ncbi:MAG: Glu-tRNA(Gln) amidotransferase subunit GatD [Nanoarchaeota archaeon]|nr:Glu-tRNA(Gln) amidotransferase subunit GatD [Nanoarchaeota archaeon]